MLYCHLKYDSDTGRLSEVEVKADDF